MPLFSILLPAWSAQPSRILDLRKVEEKAFIMGLAQAKVYPSDEAPRKQDGEQPYHHGVPILGLGFFIWIERQVGNTAPAGNLQAAPTLMLFPLGPEQHMFFRRTLGTPGWITLGSFSLAHYILERH